MRYLALVLVLFLSKNLAAQTILDSLARPSQSGDSELQRVANEDANNQANAAAKRASLLTRRANELRSQVDTLEKKLAALEAEHFALKSAVAEGRDLVVELFSLCEKQDATTIPSHILKIRTFYETTLLPKLAPKSVSPSAEAEVHSERELSKDRVSEERLRETDSTPRKETPPAGDTSVPSAIDKR